MSAGFVSWSYKEPSKTDFFIWWHKCHIKPSRVFQHNLGKRMHHDRSSLTANVSKTWKLVHTPLWVQINVVDMLWENVLLSQEMAKFPAISYNKSISAIANWSIFHNCNLSFLNTLLPAFKASWNKVCALTNWQRQLTRCSSTWNDRSTFIHTNLKRMCLKLFALTVVIIWIMLLNSKLQQFSIVDIYVFLADIPPIIRQNQEK